MSGKAVYNRAVCPHCGMPLPEKPGPIPDYGESAYPDYHQHFHSVPPPETGVKIGFFAIVFFHALLFTALSLLLGPSSTQYGWPFVVIDTAAPAEVGTRTKFLVDGFLGNLIIFYMAGVVFIGILWILIRTATAFKSTLSH
jgi:hypothetical protein